MKRFNQKLILLLSASGLLAFSPFGMIVNSKNNERNNQKIEGFHITVKSSNHNLVNSIETWNNDSQYLYANANANPLAISFANYEEIIGNDWINDNNQNKNIINDQGYHQLQNLIKDNSNNFKNAQGFVTASAFGHTFNEKSNNLIVKYSQKINESIDTGLFATIYEASNVSTLMEVPYDLQPDVNFQKSEFENRAKIFPIGHFENTKDSFSNEMFVFYVHSPFKKAGLEILINNQNGQTKQLVKTNAAKTFDYAILNQDYHQNMPTTYTINWHAADGTTNLKKETVTINSSMPDVQIVNDKEQAKSSLTHQYFINKKSSDLQITAFSQIKTEAIITANLRKDKWRYQRVDDNLSPQGKPTWITNQPLKPYQTQDHTIYLLQRIVNDKVDSASSQYLNIFNIKPLIPNFSQLISFANSQLAIDFKQYLEETTNIDCAVNVLTPGQLRYWLLFYEHDLLNKLYVNIKHKQDNFQNSDNPFALSPVTLVTKTLVNNWNIIIIGSTILLVTIAIPIVMAISRKMKIKK